MLSGDNGLLKRAGDARDDTVVGQEKEQVELAYVSAAVKKLGTDVDESDMQTELNNSVGNNKTKVSTNTDDTLNVLFYDTEHNYNVNTGTVTRVADGAGTGTELGEGETQTVSDLRAASISDGVTAISADDEPTTIKDNKDNEIKIPKGFGIATDSGINVAEGIVIEDADSSRTTYGSQFVWIPVGTITKTDGNTETITLGRYTFDSNNGTPTLIQGQSENSYKKSDSSSAITQVVGNKTYYYYEFSDYLEKSEVTSANLGNTYANNLVGFVESTIRNGGYYIARYEAGVKGTDTSNTGSTYTINTDTFTKNSTAAGYIVTKQGVGVWNNITQSNAVTVCGNMYTDVNSDLINSYAWDTAIVFIEKCGTNNNYANQQPLQNTLTTTGNASNGTNKDKQCNIYDMAGNLSEYTTESKTPQEPCVARGGDFSDTAFPAYRFGSSTDGDYYYNGFRPILFL